VKQINSLMTEIREKSMLGWVKQWLVVISFDLMAATTTVQWSGVVLTRRKSVISM
jgi:hypothetical protein